MAIDEAGRYMPQGESGRVPRPVDQEALVLRLLERRRRDPDVDGVGWLLALIPAMTQSIESSEWSGSPPLLATFLEATLGPLPPCLACPSDLVSWLRRATPHLGAWGYHVRIESGPDGGEVVSIDGTIGSIPG